MAQPSKEDLVKKEMELEKHLKKLSIRDTGKQKIPSLITLVRGAIRASWAISPVKLAYYEMGRIADTSTELRKWKMQCEVCKTWCKCDEIEIDHLTGNHKFTCTEDFVSYFDNILDVEFKDLQRICKYKCHRVKSHMEKYDHPDMYTACVDKIIIFLVKYLSTEELTNTLNNLQIVPESTAKKRRTQLYDWLLKLDIEENNLMLFFESCDHIMRLDTKYKKAKKFRLSGVDREMIKRYNFFWDNVRYKPVTTIKVLSSREVLCLEG